MAEYRTEHQNGGNECKEAARIEKKFAKQMILMADCFGRISTSASLDVSKVVEEKLEEKISENQRQITHFVQQVLSNYLQQMLQIRYN